MMKQLIFLLSLFLFSCSTNNGPEQKPDSDSAKIYLKPERDTLSANKSDNLHSEIICPKCGFKKVELLPTDYCLLNYTCSSCQFKIEPKEEDCCVFCSYGDKKCPSKQ
jgi:hypothetical protein